MHELLLQQLIVRTYKDEQQLDEEEEGTHGAAASSGRVDLCMLQRSC
jgi:hypothetical protein